MSHDQSEPATQDDRPSVETVSGDGTRPNQSVDGARFLDDLEAIAGGDAAALRELSELFDEVKTAERSHPPDRDDLWSRVVQRIAEAEDDSRN